MRNRNWTPREEAQEEEKLATYIADQVIGRASGRLEEECLFNMPRDRYFIGSLRSAAGENNENENRLLHDLWNKLAPVAFGAEFLACLEGDELAIEVTVRWACYYRVFPTRQQQLDFLQVATTEQVSTEPQVAKEKNAEIVESEDNEERAAHRELERERQQAQDERRQQQEIQDTLCPRFRKMFCEAIGHIIFRKGTGSTLDIDKSDLENALYAEIQRASYVASKDSNRLRSNDSNLEGQVNVSDVALTSDSEYNCFKEQLRNEIPLSWEWDVQVECSVGESISNADKLANKVVSINFSNTSSMPDRSLTRENFLFDASAEFRFIKGYVIPFTLELAPRGFRYDRDLWGRGFNCAVEKISETEYRTTHTPYHSQMRYLTSTEPMAPI